MPSGRPGGEKPDEASPCAALLAGRSDACGYPPIGTNPERSRSPMRIVRAQISEQTARRRCDKKRLGVAKKSVSPRIIKRSAGVGDRPWTGGDRVDKSDSPATHRAGTRSQVPAA